MSGAQCFTDRKKLTTNTGYDNIHINVLASPSQGLRSFLEVYARIIDYRLGSIRATNSEEQLKSTLLDLAQHGFRVWTATGRWNETSSSSLSHSGGSDPFSLSSWDYLPSSLPTRRLSSPNPPGNTVLPSLEQSNAQQDAAEATTNIFRGPTHIPNPQADTRQFLFPVGNPHNVNQTMPIPGDFRPAPPLGTELQTYSYPSNIPDNLAWQNQMQQIQLNSSNSSYDDVGLGGSIHTNDFDIGGMPPNRSHGMNMDSHGWEHQYPSNGFPRYNSGP